MGMLQQTAAQYRSLRMTAISAELARLLAEAEASEMSFLSFAQRLAEYELQQRQANRVQRNHKAAGFPAQKHLEGFDYRHQSTISKRQVNSLYEYRSIILTTNKDFTCWGEFFHDDNVAVPIIDRIIHHSHIFMLGGESYRLKQKTTG